jgi:hypothetical protein
MIRAAEITLCMSFLLYMMVQLFGWHVPAWPTGELYFNPFAWQFLFVVGVWYSCECSPWLQAVVQSRIVLAFAIVYLAFSLIVVLSWQFKSLGWLLPEQMEKLIYPIDKSHMAPLRLFHFLALAIVVSRMTSPDWRGPIKSVVVGMIRCGENSLVIYCLGVLLAFLAHVILVEVSASLVMQIAVSIGGIVVMVSAATLWTWEAQLDRRGPRLF